MAHQDRDDRPLSSLDELVSVFAGSMKPPSSWRLGVEQEKVGVYAHGGIVPFAGPQGIEEVLRRLLARGYEAAGKGQGGAVVEFARDGERITLEPGGQLEHSGATLPTARASADALERHVREVQEVAAPLGITFLGVGARPWGALDDVPWLPKRRYEIMRSYLPTRGNLGPWMMKQTATVQANLDFDSERNAMEKMRTAMAVTSIVTALVAASPIVEGRPNGYQSFRAAIWLDTDPDRCGLLPFAFDERAGFADYASWALDVPLFFVATADDLQPAPGFTFRRFMQEGFHGRWPTLADWELHLSTLFPEVRLKRYLEVRGADACPLPEAKALGALWRGILDDATARASAWDLMKALSYEERVALRAAVPREGLKARARERDLGALARDLIVLAEEGLGRLPGGEDDRALLGPLAARAASGRSRADEMLDDYEATGGDPTKLIPRWALVSARGAARI